MSTRRGPARWGAAVVALALLGLAGCGGGLKTYPVRGKVVLADGDVQQLAESHVEFMLESDPMVRADGIIHTDGSFALQMQHKGKLLKGAPEGMYRGRIILSDDADGGAAKRAQRPVHPRFLQFKTSGLSLKVPPDDDVTVTVSRR